MVLEDQINHNFVLANASGFCACFLFSFEHKCSNFSDVFNSAAHGS